MEQTNLPTELWLDILAQCAVSDVLNFRQTCRLFRNLCRARLLWHALLHSSVLLPNLPTPGLKSRDPHALASLSAADLERATLRALALRRAWYSDHSTSAHASDAVVGFGAVRVRTLPTTHNTGLIRVLVALQFLRGRFLLRIVTDYTSYERRTGRSTVECWDLDGDAFGFVCSARIEFGTPLASAAVNKDAESPYLLALAVGVSESPEPYTALYSLDESGRTFSRIRTISGYRRPLLLQGPTLLTSDVSEETVRLWDVSKDSTTEDFELAPTEYLGYRPKILAAVFIPTRKLVILFQVLSVKFYVLPTPLSDGKRTVLRPTARHEFVSRISHLSVCERRPRASQLSASEYAPAPVIDMLLRFDSSYVHHFQLRPLPFHALLTSTTPTVPYCLKPYSLSSWRSQLRWVSQMAARPAPWYLALGPCGTALWTDITDNYGPSGADFLRVRAIGFAGVASDGRESKERTMVCCPAGLVWNGMAIDEDEGRIALGDDTDGEVSIFEYV